MHVEPGKCFIGGGLWHPDGPAVARLRASIDERPQRWRRVLLDPEFRDTFLLSFASDTSTSTSTSTKSSSKSKPNKSRPKPKSKEEEKPSPEEDEKAALKAFADLNSENALKTKPKGFIAEHRDIELLKLRNFTVSKKVPDEVFTKAGGQEEVMAIVRAMVGFVSI